MAAFYDPSVIVFDGNTPYSGLLQTLRRAARRLELLGAARLLAQRRRRRRRWSARARSTA